ncbi:MAG: amidohydrolase family protein [Planctomycetota bacterium]|nr:amidohydrolase family protein [Planctomycetota bacterium]
MRTNSICSIVSAVLLLTASAVLAEPIDADAVFTGGMLIDGTGGPAVAGEVAIRGDRIVAVGTFEHGTVGMQIDCRELVIAPGFIDLHNHSDAQVLDPHTRGNVNYLMQGCTTIVTGNCGSGPVDAGEYYRKIDEAGCGTHVAHLLPQGSLRDRVLGLAQRPATAEELEKMKTLADRAMRDGVWGMSTGLIYVPSSYASTEEITEIARVVGTHGGLYASHIRGEGLQVLAAVQEALDIGANAGTPVHISHFKSTGREAWGLVRRAAELVETARRSGRKVTADQYPYIASSTSLDATVIPTWALAGGPTEFQERLADPDKGIRIREAIEDALQRADGGARIKLARYAKQPDWAGRSIADVAQQRNTTPLEVVLEITRNGGAAVVNFGMSEDDVRYVMTLPWVATASDGRAYLPGADRPHPRSYGTFSRKLGHYAIREQVISLEMAVRSATSLPAEILGLNDRGVVKLGNVADLVVFSKADLIDAATYDAPHQYARGMRYVYVAGQPAVWEGIPTGALRGKSLRRPLGEGNRPATP